VRMEMCCKQHIHASARSPQHGINQPENSLAGINGLDSGHNASSYINTAQRFSPIPVMLSKALQVDIGKERTDWLSLPGPCFAHE